MEVRLSDDIYHKRVGHLHFTVRQFTFKHTDLEGERSINQCPICKKEYTNLRRHVISHGFGEETEVKDRCIRTDPQIYIRGSWFDFCKLYRVQDIARTPGIAPDIDFYFVTVNSTYQEKHDAIYAELLVEGIDLLNSLYQCNTGLDIWSKISKDEDGLFRLKERMEEKIEDEFRHYLKRREKYLTRKEKNSE